MQSGQFLCMGRGVSTAAQPCQRFSLIFKATTTLLNREGEKDSKSEQKKNKKKKRIIFSFERKSSPRVRMHNS